MVMMRLRFSTSQIPALRHNIANNHKTIVTIRILSSNSNSSNSSNSIGNDNNIFICNAIAVSETSINEVIVVSHSSTFFGCMYIDGSLAFAERKHWGDYRPNMVEERR